jgi:hypothetical protein
MRRSRKEEESSAETTIGGNGRKLKVEQLAARLNCKAGELYKEIERNGWAEAEGVYNILPSKGRRGLRVNEWEFCHRRQLSPSMLADQRLRDAHKAFLSLALPMRSLLDHYINESLGVYEAVTDRLEATTPPLPPPQPDGTDS